MTQRTDPKAAYLAGVLDGFRLSRANTQAEAEDLIAAINEGDVEARIRAAQAESGRRQTTDDIAETERDPETRLN
jgi:hypothetical protein